MAEQTREVSSTIRVEINGLQGVSRGEKSGAQGETSSLQSGDQGSAQGETKDTHGGSSALDSGISCGNSLSGISRSMREDDTQNTGLWVSGSTESSSSLKAGPHTNYDLVKHNPEDPPNSTSPIHSQEGSDTVFESSFKSRTLPELDHVSMVTDTSTESKTRILNNGSKPVRKLNVASTTTRILNAGSRSAGKLNYIPTASRTLNNVHSPGRRTRSDPMYTNCKL